MDRIRIPAVVFPFNPPMKTPALLVSGLLLSGLTWAASPARAESSHSTSRISEVDACNQAQYQMPEKAVVQGFRLGTSTDRDGALFSCKVLWSTAAGAAPTDRPILFPNAVPIPIIWSGWF